MFYRYAQINEEGFVVSDSYLSGEVIADNMIAIDESFDLTNQRYVNGEWIEYEPKPIEEQPNPKLDQASTLLADLLAQQEQDILNELEGVLNE